MCLAPPETHAVRIGGAWRSAQSLCSSSWVPEWMGTVYSSLQQTMLCKCLAAAAQLVGCSEQSCQRLHGVQRPETEGSTNAVQATS